MKWVAVLFGLFIVLIIVMANLGALGILGFINSIPYGDKVGHFILYGILTFLIDLSFLRRNTNSSSASVRPNPNLIVLRIALILAFLIGLEEYSQLYFPSRTFDLVDLAFSYLGLIFFSWLALRIKKKGRSIGSPL